VGADLLDMQVCGGASAGSGDADGPLGKPLFHEKNFHRRVSIILRMIDSVLS
jgi:hypothetical protein